MLKSRGRRRQLETPCKWRPWWQSHPTRFAIQRAALRFPPATTMSTMRLTRPKREDGSTGSRSMPASPRLHYKTYPDLGSLNDLNQPCSPANSVGSIPELPPLPKKPFPPMASSYAPSKRADRKKLPYVAGSYPVINIEDFAVGSLPKTVKTKKAPTGVVKQTKTATSRTEFGHSLVIDLNAAMNGCRDPRSERRSSYEDRTTTGRSSSRLTSPSMAHSLSWSGSDLKNKLRQSKFKTSLLQSPNVSGETFGSLSQTSSPTISTISLVDRCTNKRNNSDPEQGTTTEESQAHRNKNREPDGPPQQIESSSQPEDVVEELEEKQNIEKCLKWLKDVAIAKEHTSSKEMTPPPHLLG
ncbi:PREDICTED: uncharacterized protein LOC109481142 [Branchiostoma belcheri]|uniref:Uncharacterized protein LOC109481142 n=1 Tax=Branchiostoma belcheri TaxID=7741 RepID=A0A6P4ZD13_BRABE|nr:PREDICTED: uncharacterized protein LOC109481142 [Branchiostoma belcheri]